MLDNIADKIVDGVFFLIFAISIEALIGFAARSQEWSDNETTVFIGSLILARLFVSLRSE